MPRPARSKSTTPQPAAATGAVETDVAPTLLAKSPAKTANPADVKALVSKYLQEARTNTPPPTVARAASQRTTTPARNSTSAVAATTPARASGARASAQKVSSNQLDGEQDTAPEVASSTGSFFSASDRVYSRTTTQRLTDLAGGMLLVFLAIYMTLSGMLIYVEVRKQAALN